MTTFKKRALSLLTSVCMLAGAMSVMTLSASAASGRVPQAGGTYRIQLSNDLYMTTDGTNVYAAPLDYNNTNQSFIYTGGTNAQLESVKYKGKYVMTDESPFITKKNVYLGAGWNNYWRMENDGVNNYSFRHLYTNEDPQYIVFNTGTWTGNGSDPTTAAGNVWACPSQQLGGRSNRFRFVSDSDLTPPEPEFSVGYHGLKSNNGQYLAIGADGAAVMSDTPYTWYVSDAGNGGYRLSPASDLNKFLYVAHQEQVRLVDEPGPLTVIFPFVAAGTEYVVTSSVDAPDHNYALLGVNNGTPVVSGGQYFFWTLI